LDGEIEVDYVKPDQPQVPAGNEGSIKLNGKPKAKKMGWVKDAAWSRGFAQFRRATQEVLLVQTIIGDCTTERSAESCQTKA
jgi:hypothetical protein